MTWSVFGVSCLLVLAGAVSITFGAPIIQLERGWAEVIAGSVAVSSGGVVFALGVVLMRLEALRDATAAARPPGVPFAVREVSLQPLPSGDGSEAMSFHMPEPESPPPAPMASAPPMPQAAPEATPVSAEEDVDDATSDQGLWKRIRRPPERSDAKPADMPSAAVDLSPEPVFESKLDKAPTVESIRPAAPSPAVPPTPRPEPAAPFPEAAKPADDEAGQLGWLERSLFKTRASRQPTNDAAEPSTRVEPVLGGLIGDSDSARSGRSTDAVATAPVLTATDARFGEAPATAADEGPTVIGRYQAGVASYVMYSDGTIEVETEGGQSHRFGSMDELKAFIAKEDKAET